MPDCVVVGGGIIGTATAFELTRRGASVTILEARTLASMGSGWTLGGVRQSGRHPAELPLALAAVDIWPKLDTILGCSVEYRQRGNLRLARTEAEAAIVRKLVADQRDAGLDLCFLADNSAVRDVAPAISRTIVAASFCPSDGHANPIKTVRAYADAARQGGCNIREQVAVTGIETRGNRVTGVRTSDGSLACDTVVVAAGVHSPSLLEPLGLALPLEPHVVSVLQTSPAAPQFDQVFGVANADCAGRQEVDGRFRVTTGIGRWPHPIEGWTRDQLRPSCATIATMINRIGAVLPILGDLTIADMWSGLIDLTPDALPVVDAPEVCSGLVVAAGFSGHGFGIGPIVGQLVADLASGREPALPLDAFKLSRFGGGIAEQAPLTLHG